MTVRKLAYLGQRGGEGRTSHEWQEEATLRKVQEALLGHLTFALRVVGQGKVSKGL